MYSCSAYRCHIWCNWGLAPTESLTHFLFNHLWFIDDDRFRACVHVCEKVLCPVPDCIHAFILSDELNELLDSQTELEATLSGKQTKESHSTRQPARLHSFYSSLHESSEQKGNMKTSKITLAVLRLGFFFVNLLSIIKVVSRNTYFTAVVVTTSTEDYYSWVGRSSCPGRPWTKPSLLKLKRGYLHLSEAGFVVMAPGKASSRLLPLQRLLYLLSCEEHLNVHKILKIQRRKKTN